MRGFYPDERVDGKIWNLNNYFYHLIYSFFKKKEKQFLQSSEINISLTKNAKKEIISWNLKNLSPFEIIPCCTDFNLFNQKTKNMRNELGIKEKDFVISYVGSLGTWYMLDEMLLFFKSFIKINKNVKFLFITKENKNMILSSAKKHDISLNDIIVTASERVNVPSYINSSDISIFFILPCYSKKASSPTKMGEIMSLGIPIVCNKGVGDVDDIMSSCMPNLLVNNFSEDEFNRVIKKIINNDLPSKIKIKKYAEDNLSLHIGVKKYLKTYNKILLK